MNSRMDVITVTEDADEFTCNAYLALGEQTTLIDAGMELANGRPKSAALLAGAAAVSTRVPGFGTAISLLLRGYRRIR